MEPQTDEIPGERVRDALLLDDDDTWNHPPPPLPANLALTLMGKFCAVVCIAIGVAVAVWDVKNILMLAILLPVPLAVMWLVWWRRERGSVGLDLVLKVFTFGFIPGTLISMIAEMIVMAVAFLLCFSGKLDEIIALLPKQAQATLENTTPSPLPEGEMKDLIMTFVRGSVVRVVVFMFLVAYCVAAGVEESIKYCVPVSFRRVRAHPCPSIYVVAATTVALGFSTMENIGYVCFGGRLLSITTQVVEALGRALLATPLHSVCGAIIGVGLTRRHVLREEGMSIPRVMAPSIMLHGSFDFVQFVLLLVEMDETVMNVLVIVISCAMLGAGTFYLRWAHKNLHLERFTRDLGHVEMA